MKTMSMPRRRGFTLIELLIVVVINGILASIAIPKFNEMHQKAFNSAALSDLKSTAHAIDEYFADNYALPDENQLIAAGFVLSQDVSFMTFEIRDPGDPKRSSPDLCVKAEEAPRLRLGCLGDLLFLEE